MQRVGTVKAQRSPPGEDDLDAARAAVLRAPDDPAGWFRLCRVLLERRDPEAAGIGARLERYADYAPGWCELGGVLLRAGQVEAALVVFTRATAADPDLAAAHLGRGLCLRQMGDIAAVAAFERAVRLDDTLAEGWFALGGMRQDCGDLGGAVEAYRAALRASPDLHEAAFNLGVALLDCGEVEPALDAFARALHTRPSAFGRVAQALVSGPVGCLWLDPEGLRRALSERDVGAL